jgi:zinc transport system substrate-binding protein
MQISRWLAFLTLVTLGSCREPSAEDADSRLRVFAGIPPLAYLAEQIGGAHVRVDVLVQPGQDPHTFEPTPAQVRALGKAALFLKIDMPFEDQLLQRIAQGNRRLTIVDTTKGMKKRAMKGTCGSPDAGHDHHHDADGAPDPHVWLSPLLLKIQAENVAAALCQADGKHEADYRRNLAALLDRLNDLHRQIAQRLAPYRGRAFYVFHPGFGYFADTYGLREVAIEAGGRSPTTKSLRTLIEQARADQVKTIFVQPQSPSQSAEVIAKAIDGHVVTINGLDHDVLHDIQSIAAHLETAMKQSASRTEMENAKHGD